MDTVLAAAVTFWLQQLPSLYIFGAAALMLSFAVVKTAARVLSEKRLQRAEQSMARSLQRYIRAEIQAEEQAQKQAA